MLSHDKVSIILGHEVLIEDLPCVIYARVLEGGTQRKEGDM